MGILDPIFSGASRAAPTGSGVSRQMGDALLEIQRRRPNPMPLALLPAMTVGAPGVTSAKGSGVSAAAIAGGGTGYVTGELITLAGGTNSVPAVLRVGAVSGGAITSASVYVPGLYTVNPTNPVSQASTTGSGTGATFNLTLNGGVGGTVPSATLWARNNAAFRYLGNGPSDVTAGYFGNTVGNGTAMFIEFFSDAPKLDVRLVGNNSIYSLEVDDVRINGGATVVTDSSGAAYVCTIDWAGVAIPRKYRIKGVNTAFGGVNVNVAYTLWASPASKLPFGLWMGDSYTYGTLASNLFVTDIPVVSRALGIDFLPDGIGGTGWTSSGSSLPATRVAQKILALTEVPQVVVFSLGYNDAGGNMATLSTNLTAAVAALRAGLPRVKIIIIGPATPIGSTANLTTVKTTIQGLCTTLGLPFVDIENWVNANNKGLYTGGDNVHPIDAGYAFRGARFPQVLSPLL